MQVKSIVDLEREVSSVAQAFSGRRDKLAANLKLNEDLGINGTDFILFVENIEGSFGVDLSPILHDSQDLSTTKAGETQRGFSISRLVSPPSARDISISEIASFLFEAQKKQAGTKND